MTMYKPFCYRYLSDLEFYLPYVLQVSLLANLKWSNTDNFYMNLGCHKVGPASSSYCDESFYFPAGSAAVLRIRIRMFLTSWIRIRSSEVRSRSFYHYAKIVRKTLIPTVFHFFLNDVNALSKSNKQKN
jgi:hypothetical protein